MLPRFSSFFGSAALVSALGCGSVDAEVSFEPLGEVAAAGMAQAASGAGGTMAGAAGSAGSSADSAGAATGTSGAGGGVAPGAGGIAGSAEPSGCAALAEWLDAPYQLGQRVVSTCQLPYNGACPASETREFECQPPTGSLGLGWCRDRQPGVVNGWDEAWLMHGSCPD